MSNLTPEIESNIAQSDEAGGVWLKDVPVGGRIDVQTNNTLYSLENREDGWYICGHSRFCPVPTKCSVHGSTWGGSMLKMGFVGIGMHLEFSVAGFPTLMTSAIQEVSYLTPWTEVK